MGGIEGSLSLLHNTRIVVFGGVPWFGVQHFGTPVSRLRASATRDGASDHRLQSPPSRSRNPLETRAPRRP